MPTPTLVSIARRGDHPSRALSTLSSRKATTIAGAKVSSARRHSVRSAGGTGGGVEGEDIGGRMVPLPVDAGQDVGEAEEDAV